MFNNHVFQQLTIVDKVLIMLGIAIYAGRLVDQKVPTPLISPINAERPIAELRNDATGEHYAFQQITTQPTCLSIGLGLKANSRYSIFAKGKLVSRHVMAEDLLLQTMQCLNEKFDDAYTVNSQHTKIDKKRFDRTKIDFVNIFADVLKKDAYQKLSKEGLEQLFKMISDINISAINKELQQTLPLGSGGVLVFDQGYFRNSLVLGFEWNSKYSDHHLLQAANNLLTELYKQLPAEIFTFQTRAGATRPGHI